MRNLFNKSLHRFELEGYLVEILPGLGGRILDVGAKNRRYDYLLFSRPVAVDLIANPQNEIIKGDIQELPFGDGEFDSVICLEVLEYVESPEKAAQELYRVLSSGGRLVISVPFMMKIHEDRARYTEKHLRELFNMFGSLEIIRIGNFYTIIIDILRSKITGAFLPLKIIFGVFWLLLFIFLPIARLSCDPRYASGYLIQGKK